MGKIAIKNRLIRQINEIEDESYLKELELILSHLHSDNKELYKLNSEMVSSVEAAEEDIKYRRVKSHEDVMKEAKKWLKKK